MNDFVTIKSFTYPSEVALARVTLESNGIECRTLDENTVQTHNFLSQAIGGVKLQVRQPDAELAISLLSKGGFSFDQQEDSVSKYDIQEGASKFFKWVMVVLGAISIFVVIMILYNQLNKPSLSERIVSGAWCLGEVYYGEDVYYPSSKELSMIISGSCRDRITFKEGGELLIPGFGNGYLSGTWSQFGDSLVISDIDSFGYVYNGRYQVEIDGPTMYFDSYSTTLVCITDRGY